MNPEPAQAAPQAATPSASLVVVHRVPLVHYIAWFLALLVAVPSLLLLLLCANLSRLAPAETPASERIARIWTARSEILAGSAAYLAFATVIVVALFYLIVVYVLGRHSTRGVLQCGNCGARLGANTARNLALLSQAGLCRRCGAALRPDNPGPSLKP